MMKNKYTFIISILFVLGIQFPVAAQVAVAPPSNQVTGNVCIGWNNGNCIEWAPNAIGAANDNLADLLRPYWCNVARNNCNYTWYPSEFDDIYPVVRQQYHFDWNRTGVSISGQGTPNSIITMSSGNDVDFYETIEERDDGNWEPVVDGLSMSRVWPLWTNYRVNGYGYYPDNPGDSISVGDYSSGRFDHALAPEGTTQFSTSITNMEMIDFPIANSADFLPVVGDVNDPNTGKITVFNMDIRTGIPQIPEVPGATAGVPPNDSGDALLLGLAAGAMGLFGTGDSTDDSYGQKPFSDWVAQITTMDNKVEEQNQATVDAEQQDKSMQAIQKEKIEAIADNTPDELVCTIISISKKDVVQSSFRKKANTHAIRNNLMSNFQRKKGSLGSLSDRERLQYRVEDVRQNHCSTGGAGSAFEQFCIKPAGLQANELAHLSPNCLHGSKTRDSDPAVGDIDPSCMQNMILTSPAHTPIKLPSVLTITEQGTSDYESAIAEYVPALTNHAHIVSDSIASMHASTIKTSGESVGEFRALMEELGFSEEEIGTYIPESGGGLSEIAQLEIVSKFMIGNPNFFIGLQTNETNVSRVRTLIRTISLTLDHHINEMVANKGRQMAGLHALLLRDDRERANSGLTNANID